MSRISTLIQSVRSGVVGIRFFDGDTIISSGSGFLFMRHLISNSHVFNPGKQPLPASTIVKLRFGDTLSDEDDVVVSNLSEFELIVGSHQDSYDYAVYKLPEKFKHTVESRHSFKLSASPGLDGEKVVFIGFPFDSGIMTSHVGYISAKYMSGGIEIIQLDASINNGNSGGPLLDIGTGEVIVIVTRKKTGLSQEFDDLINSFKHNIKALESNSGTRMVIGGVDPVDLLKISQYQMMEISKNIDRSANVGIGYAFSISHLKKEKIQSVALSVHKQA